MEMVLWLSVAFVVEVAFFSFLGRRLFQVPQQSQFVSFRAYREYSEKVHLRVRESHLVEAGFVALTCGLIACYFLSVYFLPVVATVVVFEAVWLMMTYEFRPHLQQNYVIKSNLLTAGAVSLVIGIFISLLAGASLLPVLIAVALFWVAWLLLMPM
jgi:hypothetical protein